MQRSHWLTHASGSVLTVTSPITMGRYMLLWICLSASVILMNKYILDPELGGFPFPLTLTCIHMAFCSIVAWTMVKTGLVAEQPVAFDLYIRWGAVHAPAGDRRLAFSCRNCSATMCSMPVMSAVSETATTKHVHPCRHQQNFVHAGPSCPLQA